MQRVEQRLKLHDADLDGDITIIKDRFGLSHIFADTERDVFFGQGFNVASERLWQIDLWRRRGLGLLAEVLGPGFLAQDRASRLFTYCGDMDVEWASYPPNTKAICEDFCRGVNAYIKRVLDSGQLPAEFKALGYLPSMWRAAEIVRIRTNTLTANAVSELQRAVLFGSGLESADRLRGILRPKRPEIRPDFHIRDGAELVKLMELAVAPVIITRERLDAGMSDIERWSDPRAFLPRQGPEPKMPEISPLPADGSNNWAIAGSRTATGSPILANDPHRALQLPSLRYVVHLHCPSFSIIGAGEPSLPGVSIGHNGTVAFGLTIFPADQEDVFQFDIPGGSASARLTRRKERIAVRGGSHFDAEFHYLDGSPVLRLDDTVNKGIAVRTVWSEPGASPYLGSLAFLKIKSVAEFRDALATWRLPAVNFVAADKSNSIGWFVAGSIPDRREGFGYLPRHSNENPWRGFLPNAELPTTLDPASGYVMSANEFNLPSAWDSTERLVAFEWYEDFRARRIHEVLGKEESATVPASLALQDDAVSMAARDLLRLLAFSDGANEPNARSENAARLLAWTGAIDNETREAAFYSLWTNRFLKPAVLAIATGGKSLEAGIEISLESAIEELRGMNQATRKGVLFDTLEQADRSFMGDSFQARRALFRHAIQDGVVPGVSFSAKPTVWSGDDTTVRLGKSGGDANLIEFGASFRIVIDLANWDNSRWSNIPGQTSYNGGKAAAEPLLYSPDRIGSEASSVAVLTKKV